MFAHDALGRIDTIDFNTNLANLSSGDLPDIRYQYGYDSQNRRTDLTVTPGANPLAGLSLHVAYDARGRLLELAGSHESATMPLVTYAYSPLGQWQETIITRSERTAAGSTTAVLETIVSYVGQDLWIRHRAKDTTSAEPLAVTHTYLFDSLGRVTGLHYTNNTPYQGPDGQPASLNKSVTYDFDPIGWLKSVTTNGQTQEFGYDRLGNPDEAQIGPNNRVLAATIGGSRYSFEYDDEGNLTIKYDYGQPKITNARSFLGSPAELGSNANWDVQSGGYGGEYYRSESPDAHADFYVLNNGTDTYYSVGGATIRLYGAVPDANAAATFDPAARYELFDNLTLLANTDGQTSRVVDQTQQPSDYFYAGQHWTYLGTYVLPEATLDNSLRLRITQSEGASEGLMIDAVLVERVAGITTYEYDSRNRLLHVANSNGTGQLRWAQAYYYDVFDRRIAIDTTQGTTGNTQREFLVYDGQSAVLRFASQKTKVLGILDYVWLQQRMYYEGPGRLLAVHDANVDRNRLVWTLNDRQDSVVDLFGRRHNSNQYGLLGHRTYDSHGSYTVPNGLEEGGEHLLRVPVAFQGQDYHQKVSLYAINGRWYDPELGLYIQESGKVDGTSPYGYQPFTSTPAIADASPWDIARDVGMRALQLGGGITQVAGGMAGAILSVKTGPGALVGVPLGWLVMARGFDDVYHAFAGGETWTSQSVTYAARELGFSQHAAGWASFSVELATGMIGAGGVVQAASRVWGTVRIVDQFADASRALDAGAGVLRQWAAVADDFRAALFRAHPRLNPRNYRYRLEFDRATLGANGGGARLHRQYDPGTWVWKIRDKGIERQRMVTGRPIRVRADGRLEIQEYLLDGHHFDGFDARRGILREVKDDYAFAFGPQGMPTWGQNGRDLYEAWGIARRDEALRELAIAKRHGFRYEYLVDPRHLNDWRRVLGPAIDEGLILKAW